VTDLPRGRECARMVPIVPDLPAPAECAIDRLGHADGEALDAATQFRVRVDEQVT